MKVRWSKNSIRFRISPTEFEALRRGEAVEEILLLPAGGWRASIVPGAEGPTSFAARGADLALMLCAADLAHLAEPESEGVYFRGELPSDFRYFVEKDFPCAHPTAAKAREPVTETFSPPPDFNARKTQN